MNDKLSYYVNEDKRTVVCVAENCQEDLIRELSQKFVSSNSFEKNIISNILSICYDDFLLNYKYIGKASCSKDDKFDIEKGKIIARQKMRHKYNQAKISILQKYCTSMNNILETLMKNWEFYLDSRDKHYDVLKQYWEE
jgi:hypothetical protein